jgi:hypothetical protein
MIGIRYHTNFTEAMSYLGTVATLVAKPDAMMKVVGRRGNNELKAHFRRRNQTPNKLGGRRSGFWRRVADSVKAPVLESPNVVAIDISDPAFAQKLFGGTITPKEKEALTIPVDPLSYDRTVAVFKQETGIELFRLKKSGGVLTNLLMGVVGDDIRVFYVLAESVTQQPDPEALPPPDEFAPALYDEAEAFYVRQLARPNPAANPA